MKKGLMKEIIFLSPKTAGDAFMIRKSDSRFSLFNIVKESEEPKSFSKKTAFIFLPAPIEISINLNGSGAGVVGGSFGNFSANEDAPSFLVDCGKRDPMRKKVFGSLVVVSISPTEKPLLANSRARLQAMKDFSAKRLFEEKSKHELPLTGAI
jgi:hypothetical protein